ncbi:MAG TPA: helix-turn-helix domain-containing protein [Euzebya sp.]|nr:helix-turn-helix domain-containing protein [Euzebya sp.]
MPDLLPLPPPTGDEPVVAVLVLDGNNSFEVGIASEVFGIRRGEVLRHPAVDQWYDLRFCGRAPGSQSEGPGGVTTTLAYGLETLATADLVVVPYCEKPPEAERVPLGHAEPCPVDDEVVDAVRAAHERGAVVMSFCSGAFVLGQAGLLDGRPATTHWLYARAFRKRFPRVPFVEDVLYVDNGDVMTSAGSAAAMDLSLHYIRREHGADVADLIARRMVVPPHRDGGQAQYVALPLPPISQTSFADLLQWMLGNLDADLTVEDLAARAAMSPRSFARHFQQATGTTPHRWLTARRVDHARRLLETTDLPVDRVARSAGLGSAANLRARMGEAVGVTPTAYRQRFARLEVTSAVGAA